MLQAFVTPNLSEVEIQLYWLPGKKNSWLIYKIFVREIKCTFYNLNGLIPSRNLMIQLGGRSCFIFLLSSVSP